jgi:hypothetical protein
MAATKKLLSLRQLSEELKISWPVAVRLVQEKVLQPDFEATQALLFRPERLPELGKLVATQGTGLSRAIAARQRQIDKIK